MGKRDPGLGSFAHFFSQDYDSELILMDLDHTFRFTRLCEILLMLEDIRGSQEDISILVSE